MLCCRYLVPCSFLLNTSGAAAAPPEPVNHADAGTHVSQRKTAQQRLFWAQILPARMKEPEIRALHNSMQLPPPVGEARPKPAWPNKARMREILHGIPEEPWGESVPEPASKSLAGAHRRNVKDAAKRAYEDMLWQGSTAPRQSVLKVTKALRTNRGDKLDAVADIIRGGVVECDGKESAACEWPTADGAAPCPPMKRIFYSFADAKALSPKMEQLFREIGVQETHLHRLLRERFPTYRPNLKITVKPERDCAKVQAAAAVSTAAVPVPHLVSESKPVLCAGGSHPCGCFSRCLMMRSLAQCLCSNACALCCQIWQKCGKTHQALEDCCVSWTACSP